MQEVPQPEERLWEKQGGKMQHLAQERKQHESWLKKQSSKWCHMGIVGTHLTCRTRRQRPQARIFGKHQGRARLEKSPWRGESTVALQPLDTAQDSPGWAGHRSCPQPSCNLDPKAELDRWRLSSQVGKAPFLKNYRPISLMSTGTKHANNMLANRTQAFT